MTLMEKLLFDPLYQNGGATAKYPASPERIARNIREKAIQRQRDEEHRRKVAESRKLHSTDETLQK